MTDYRWIVTATYNSSVHGHIEIEHHVDEIQDVHQLIENGPDWNTLVDIKIVLNPKIRSNYSTIEEAAAR